MTATLQPIARGPAQTSLDQEQAATTGVTREQFEALVTRLSRQSVDKHFDPFVDIAWDDPEMAVDIADPRWEAVVPEPLRGTSWFQQQPAATRSAMGLTMAAGLAKNGLQFENVLQRGLLEYCFGLGNDDVRYRYAMHEVIEDYVDAPAQNRLLNVANNIFAISVAVVTIVAVAKIMFWG